MKMIFESLLLDKVEEDVVALKKEFKIEENHQEYKAQLFKVVSDVTFKYFKVSFFIIKIEKLL